MSTVYSSGTATPSGRSIEDVLEPCNDTIRIVFNGVEIANTKNGYRALETSHAPTYYIPIADIKTTDDDNNNSVNEKYVYVMYIYIYIYIYVRGWVEFIYH